MTTQPTEETAATPKAEPKSPQSKTATPKAKAAKPAETVAVKQNGDTSFGVWPTDMGRLFEGMFKSWGGFPAFQPFAGFLVPAGGEVMGPQDWREQADKYFEHLSRSWGEMTRGGPFEALRMPGSFVLKPEVDISEADGSFILKAELPGMDMKDLEVEIDADVLTISGKKSESSEEKQNDVLHRERRFGSFHRSFKLPEGAVADKAEAAFENGVLTVTLPKQIAAKAKGRKVAVKG